ncbi:YcxB family protein [Morganella morganii]|nr:YcxB family protein [Morganella morganii]
MDYAESATGLYLYHGKYDGIIIPLRDIQSEAQKKDILHLLSQKIRNVQIKNQANKMA